MIELTTERRAVFLSSFNALHRRQKPSGYVYVLIMLSSSMNLAIALHYEDFLVSNLPFSSVYCAPANLALFSPVLRARNQSVGRD